MIPFIILAIEDPDDRAFMADLYTTFNRLMYSEILKVVHNQWDAEDVLQSMLVRLIDKVDLLRTLNKPRLINYLTTASRNVALNYVRDFVDMSTISFDETIGPTRTQRIATDVIHLLEEKDGFQRAWNALDPKSRRVLELKYFLDESDAEIADLLGIKVSSVRMTLTRARNKLKDLLNSDNIIKEI